MLRLVTITYNDMPLIQQAVESVCNLVDGIVVVDGRFEDFPQLNGSDLSTDGTLEYLDGIENVHLIEAPNLSEIHKRNCYLMGGVGDWYLHLDADEVWEGPIPDRTCVDAFVSELRRNYPQYAIPRVRLFRHVEGLHYEDKHYWLKDGDGRTFSLLKEVGTVYRGAKGGKIYHQGNRRPRARQSAKETYYRTLRARENPIKEHL